WVVPRSRARSACWPPAQRWKSSAHACSLQRSSNSRCTRRSSGTLTHHPEVRDPEAAKRRLFHQVHDVAEQAAHEAAFGPVVAARKDMRLHDELDIQPVEELFDVRLRIDADVRREVVAHEIG